MSFSSVKASNFEERLQALEISVTQLKKKIVSFSKTSTIKWSNSQAYKKTFFFKKNYETNKQVKGPETSLVLLEKNDPTVVSWQVFFSTSTLFGFVWVEIALRVYNKIK